MALVFDAATLSPEVVGGDTNTFSHTVTAADVLVVGVGGRGFFDTVTSMTYAGVAMTLIRRDAWPDMQSYTELWRLLSPAVGANNVIVTWGGTPDTQRAAAVSYAGVDATTPIEANEGGGGQPSAISVGVTSLTDGAVVVDVIWHGSGSDVAPDGAQVQRALGVISTYGDTFGMSTKALPTAGATTMAWTPSGTWALSAAVLKPAAGGGGGGGAIAAIQSYYRRRRAG